MHRRLLTVTVVVGRRVRQKAGSWGLPLWWPAAAYAAADAMEVRHQNGASSSTSAAQPLEPEPAGALAAE